MGTQNLLKKNALNDSGVLDSNSQGNGSNGQNGGSTRSNYRKVFKPDLPGNKNKSSDNN